MIEANTGDAKTVLMVMGLVIIGLDALAGFEAATRVASSLVALLIG